MVVVDYDCDDGSYQRRVPWKRNPQALRRVFKIREWLLSLTLVFGTSSVIGYLSCYGMAAVKSFRQVMGSVQLSSVVGEWQWN